MYMQVWRTEMQWECYYGVLLPASFPAMSGQCPAAWKCSRTIFALSWTGQTFSMKSQGSPHTGMINLLWHSNWSQSKQRRAVANTQDHRRERGKCLHGFRCRRAQTVPVWSCMYLYVVWWCIMMYYVVYGIVWSHVCPLDSCCPNILQYVSYRAVARILTSSPEMQQDPFSWICPPKFYKIMCLHPPWPNSSGMLRRCSSYIWYFVDLFWLFLIFFGVDRDFFEIDRNSLLRSFSFQDSFNFRQEVLLMLFQIQMQARATPRRRRRRKARIRLKVLESFDWVLGR